MNTGWKRCAGRAPGEKVQLDHASRDRLLDSILDDRLADNRQEFFRHPLDGGGNRVLSPATGKAALRILWCIKTLKLFLAPDLTRFRLKIVVYIIVHVKR